MKRLILLGVMLAAAVAYAAGFTDVDGSIAGAVSVNKDIDTVYGDQHTINPTSDPNGIPKYKALMLRAFVNDADTLSAEVGGRGNVDSANVILNGWWDGVKYRITTTGFQAGLPDTFTLVLQDTGSLKNMWFYDALSVDVICADSAGSGATDSLAWNPTYKVRLIER